MTVIKQQFNIPDTTECRIWSQCIKNKYVILADLKQAISDAGICGGQVS